MFLILVLLSACSPQSQARYQTVSGQQKNTPSPVKVIYLTATPSLTPTMGITPTMTPNEDPDYYYGGLVITLDDVGRTIKMKKRQTLLLSLGKNYIWQVMVEPEDVITLNAKITPEPGDQGIFIARGSGKAVVRAVGEPLCRFTTPPCERPSVLFQFEVQVE
jgi:hypothetical protein